jgi:hypothetical protein
MFIQFFPVKLVPLSRRLPGRRFLGLHIDLERRMYRKRNGRQTPNALQARPTVGFTRNIHRAIHDNQPRLNMNRRSKLDTGVFQIKRRRIHLELKLKPFSRDIRQGDLHARPQ